MEPVILGGMIFTLLVLLLIGGFVLLFPLTRQLGKVLELRLQDRKNPVSEAELVRLREAVDALQAQVRSLGQRQDFVDDLLKSGSPPALPSARDSEQ